MNILNSLLSIAIFLFASCAHGNITSEKYKKLDQYFNILSKHEKAMGSALILEKDKVVYSREYGFKYFPTNPLFRIGSISKTYMAVIIARLVEDGLLKYEDRLSKYYPQIPNSNSITIEHLLMHRSGLVNFTNLPNYIENAGKVTSEEKHINNIIKNGTEFSSGTKHKYSNTGYVLLTFIAQKVTDKTFSELLTKYITLPLNLNSTFVFDAKNPKTNEVSSFEKSGKWRSTTNTHQSVALGAGAVLSNTKDLASFFNALFTGKLVKKETLNRMTNFVDGYGYGLIKVPYNSKSGFAHTGGIDGFRSIATYFPDSGTVFVHLTNAMDMNMNQTSIALLASYYEDDFMLPKFKELVDVNVKTLKRYEGVFGAKGFPLKLKIFENDGFLYLQAQGQRAFALESYSDNEFGYPTAKVSIKFSEDGNEMEFTQGNKYLLKKLN